MNLQQQIYCLVLHPRGINHPPLDFSQLSQQLQTQGMLGESFLCQGERRYRLGERFYQWLTFMGCAPALRLEATGPDDEKFCHFRFSESPQAQFSYLRPEVRGRCPHCRKAGTTAAEVAADYFAQQRVWSCPHCHESCAPQDIQWKHEAGMSRAFIELLDVHPHEVAPTDSLLNELATLTGCDWQYFYTSRDCHQIIT